MSSSRGDDAPVRGRARPARGPAFETQVADARRRIGRFLGRERPRLNGGSREQRIREERKLATAREVRGLVVVQHELHQPLQEREFRLPAVALAKVGGSRVLVRGFEQRPRPFRHHAGLGQQFDDRVDRCGDVVVCRAVSARTPADVSSGVVSASSSAARK